MQDLGDRTKYIGGSDVAAIIGVSRWKTPLEMWMLKTGLKVDKPIDSIAAELGTELEDYVARRFMKETGKKVRRVNKPYVHPEKPYLQAHIDRDVVGEEALLECKTCTAWNAKAWDDDEIPGDYIMQVYFYMLLTGYKKAYIAVLIGNSVFKWMELVWDETADAVIRSIYERVVNFWENFVVPGVMPMDFKAKDEDVLEELYPTNKIPVIIDLPIELSDDLELMQSNKQHIAELENRNAVITAKIQAAIGQNDGGVCGPWEVKWKVQGAPGKLDKVGLEKEFPGAYKKYYTPGKTRKFSYKNTLEKKVDEE